MNSIHLVGNIGQTPVLRHTNGGTAVANVSLATNRVYKDAAGNRQQSTEWHRLVVWGEGAKNFAQIVATGDQLSVRGRLEYREREIAGEKVKDAVIRVHEWTKLSPRRTEQEAAAAPAESQDDGDGFRGGDEAAAAAGDVEFELDEADPAAEAAPEPDAAPKRGSPRG